MMEVATKTWQVWKENKEQITRRLKAGEDLEGYNSGFGDNDLIIGFLMVEGFWDVIKETEADLLRKHNGYVPHILNGLWGLCELAGVERVAQSGKVIGDGALLRLAGFQAEQIEKAKSRGKLRVDPETLSNHLSRIGEAAVEKSWGKQEALPSQEAHSSSPEAKDWFAYWISAKGHACRENPCVGPHPLRSCGSCAE